MNRRQFLATVLGSLWFRVVPAPPKTVLTFPNHPMIPQKPAKFD